MGHVVRAALPPRRPLASPEHRARSQDPPGFVIELFGLPGVGKSRLVAELLRASAGLELHLDRPVARIDPASPTAVRVGRKLGLAAAECALHPVRSGAAARAIVGSQRAGLAAGMPRWIHWLIVQRLMSSALRSQGSHLFDEGVLQALWSIGLRGDVTPALDQLGEAPGRWALPDLVVFVQAPLEVIRRRLSERSSRHSRLQARGDPRRRRRELARGRDLAERIRGWWVDVVADTRPVLEVDNGPTASLDDLGSSLIHEIVRHIVAQGRRPERDRSL